MDPTTEPAPEKRTGPWGFPLFKRLWPAAAVGLLVLLSLTGLIMVQAARRQTTPEPAPPLAVQVEPVQRRDIEQTAVVAGALTPALSLDLNAKATGIVARVPVVLGQTVNKGDVLLELSAADLEPQVASAAAALEAAEVNLARLEKGASWEELQALEATVSQAQTAWDQSTVAYQRMSYLYDQGAIPRQQFESAEAQVKIATAQLTAAQMQLQTAQQGADDETRRAAAAQVKQAEAGYQAALARVADTVLRAPAAGRISYVQVEVGELIAPGAPQIGLVDTRTLYLEAGVTENVVASLTQGGPVDVFVPALGQTVPGEVDQIAPAADPRSRAFPVRIAVDNAAAELVAGMTAETEVVTATAADALTVARRAVVRTGGQDVVYVVEAGLVREQPIETGALSTEHVIVTAGLAADELVVTTGAGLLRDGVRVNVVEGQ